MAHRAKRVAAAAERRWIVRSMSTRRREDCCLNIRTSFFNKDKSNYKTSILFSLNLATLNSASFPASWGSQGVMYKLARKFLLGESKTILFNSAASQTALPPLLFLILGRRGRGRSRFLFAFLAQILLDSLLFYKLFIGGGNGFFARITHRIKR